MNVLIIGASGYIGQRLYKKCKLQGYSVTGTCRKERRGEEYIKYDIGKDSIAVIRDIGKDPHDESYAIVCAGESAIGVCREKYDEIYKINVEATTALIKALKDLNYHVLFCSSDNVYDGKKGDYRETDRIAPVNAYGRMKADVERYIGEAYPGECIVRLSKVVGIPDSVRDMLADWKEKALRGNAIYCIQDNFFTPVYIEDAVNCIMLIMRRHLSGIYNICGNRKYSRIELCREFLKVLGIQADIYERPLEEFAFNDLRPLDTSMCNHKIVHDAVYEFEKLENIFDLYR